MEPTAATRLPGRSRLLFLLFLLRLLRGITAAPSGWVVGGTRGGAETDALLLSYNFSITSQAGPGPSWYKIQGQVNGNKFLSYACGSKRVKPIGPWGMKLKDTAFWDTQMEPLKDLGEELRKKLLDIKAEIFTERSKSKGPGQKKNTLAGLGSSGVYVKLRSGSQQPGQTRRPEQDQERRRGAEECTAGGAKDWSGPEADLFPLVGAGAESLTMQGRLVCECGADGHTRRSWRFVFNEQLTYLFDPENRKWIEIPPGDQQVKDMLDGDRELTELLMKIANGDCKRWLQKLREHSNEMQETPGAPATTPPVTLVKSAAIRPITSILLVVLMHSILLVVQGLVL